MPALERMISIRGPRFYRDGEAVLFVNHLDGSTRDGPREATPDDVSAHQEAYAAFGAGDPGTPFKPLVVAVDPPGGPPIKEVGPYASRRAKAET